MKIAVYSGSFNPLHIGHLAIMEHLTQQAGFDMVYLIVSPQNPFKSSENNLSAKDRYEAAVEAVKRHPELKVKVDDIELGMEPPHYTIRTLDSLREREPENTFTLIMGADNLASIAKWKDYRRILLEYGIAVFPREGYCMKDCRDAAMESDSEGGQFRITLLDAPLVNISSTQIRDAAASGRDMTDYLM